MSYHDAANFPGSMGPINPSFEFTPQFAPPGSPILSAQARKHEPEPITYHGAALARDPWAEHYGPWLVLAFTTIFALFLLGMALAGQAPGKSFSLKSISDIMQFVGEGLGCIFCIRIAARLYNVANYLRRDIMQKGGQRRSSNEMAAAHTELQSVQRAFFAWGALAIAIAFYASGQAVWTSYDVRMDSAAVPFPGIYDIGFVVSYPFFLIGTLLLTRRGKVSVGRARLLLDALAVIGTALAISWFFVLGPDIAGLAQAPSTGAAILTVYFPAGDLFLVAVGAFLMFSPLANRAQQYIFMLLCMGLFFLAITDSLLGYYNLSIGFNTGTLQDILWPLSMALIGLAAIEYPRSVAREQEQAERTKNAGLAVSVRHSSSRLAQLSMTAQTIAPFILVLATCALLLTQIAPRGGAVLIQADLVALLLILIVIARQALTLLENNRLTMQMRGELVISRRELQVTRREADEATRSVQDKRAMEEGIMALREAHARVARGDFAARAPTVPGPLLPIAISLNLMLDRLSALSLRGSKYDQLAHECGMLQEAIERIRQGLPPWSSSQPVPQGAAELRSVFLSLGHLQRYLEGQWRRLGSSLESMSSLTRRLHEALNEVRQAPAFAELGHANFERMILDRIIREVDLLEQQQRNLLTQVAHISGRGERTSSSSKQLEQVEQAQEQKQRETASVAHSAHEKPFHTRYEDHGPYAQRLFQPHFSIKPVEE